METSTSLDFRFGNDYRLGRYHVRFPRSQCHFRAWLCNYVQDRKSPLSIDSSSSANKTMTILVTSVPLCPKYLWEHLERGTFHFAPPQFSPWLFGPMHLSRISCPWMCMVEGSGGQEPKSEGGTRNKEKLQRYASVSLLSTKSHALKCLPPPKIMP